MFINSCIAGVIQQGSVETAEEDSSYSGFTGGRTRGVSTTIPKLTRYKLAIAACTFLRVLFTGLLFCAYKKTRTLIKWRFQFHERIG